MRSSLFLVTVLLTGGMAAQQLRPTDTKLHHISEAATQRYERTDAVVEKAGGNKKEGSSFSGVRIAGAPGQGWKPFTGSMNVYGVLESSGSPLQYHDELNAVSFIHRKSATYLADPFPSGATAQSGIIVGMVTQDWGDSWDSTCIWNNSTQLARYPQGGLYAAPGEKDIVNAHIVACGPVTHVNSTLGWVGSFFASKKVGVIGSAAYDSVASTLPGAQQFLANTPPYTVAKKFDYPSFDFTSTDDGFVRALALVNNNFNSTTPSIRGYRGARILKGSMNNAGTFDWTSDSLFPDVHLNANNNALDILAEPHMAWNESGTVGYVWFIGCRQGRTGSNKGFQPIVYKTSDGGNSWSEMAAINFNDPAFTAPVLDHIPATVDNPTLTIPLFNPSEGMDGVVDRNNRLHLISTVIGTSRSHEDSMGFIFRFNHGDGQQYSFAHAPGGRPYLYDFTETPSGWTVHVIDSMSSEAPGERPGQDGFDDNPWDVTGGAAGTDKVNCSARIQASRTPDGKYLIYTWAESDTAFTNLARKWNHLPNVKARMVMVGAESGTVAAGYTVHPKEINVSNPGGMTEPQIEGRSFMHYVSPKCVFISTDASEAQVAIGLPVTITNNLQLEQLEPTTHWYSASELKFDNVSVEWPMITGLRENSGMLQEQTRIFPNPARQLVKLGFPHTGGAARTEVVNVSGQELIQAEAVLGGGLQEIVLDVSSLPAGIYFVKLSTSQGSVTKKLIRE